MESLIPDDEDLYFRCNHCGFNGIVIGDPTTSGGGCKCCGSHEWRIITAPVAQQNRATVS